VKNYYDVFETPFGWMGVLASERGLRRTTLPMVSPDACIEGLGEEVERATLSPARFADLRDRLGRYFGGEPIVFDDEPIDVADATPFFRAAWKACRSIPVGETRPYKWLSTQAGKPLASRAAGQSMARNRLPIIVPCHRVIGSDGGLHGFGSGQTRLDLKQRLLDLESSRSAG